MCKLKAKIIFCFAFIFIYLVTGFSVESVELDYTNTDKGSLEIHHSHDGINLENIEFSLYKITENNIKDNLHVIDSLKDYPIDFSNLNDKTDWYLLTDTLSNYIKVDNIKAEAKLKTDENGLVLFENLELGLYLVIGETKTIDNYKYIIKPFLVYLPSHDEGNKIYDIKVKTKILKLPIYNSTNIIVQKKWSNDKKQSRPASIYVSLYKNNSFYESVSLNELNNWQYKWEEIDNSEDWTIIEENVPKDYKVSYENYEGVVIVTNNYNGKVSTELPYTGGFILKSVMINIIGIILIITGVYIRRGKKNQE